MHLPVDLILWKEKCININTFRNQFIEPSPLLVIIIFGNTKTPLQTQHNRHCDEYDVLFVFIKLHHYWIITELNRTIVLLTQIVASASFRALRTFAPRVSFSPVLLSVCDLFCHCGQRYNVFQLSVDQANQSIQHLWAEYFKPISVKRYWLLPSCVCVCVASAAFPHIMITFYTENYSNNNLKIEQLHLGSKLEILLFGSGKHEWALRMTIFKMASQTDLNYSRLCIYILIVVQWNFQCG